MSAHRRPTRPRRGLRRTVTAGVLAITAGAGTLIGAAPASAAGPWFVAPGGVNNATCGLAAATPCATVTFTIAKAAFADGDLINVAAGTYTDRPVFTTKGATLNGAGATTVFTGGAASFALAINSASGRTLTLNNLVLTNGRGVSNVGGALPILGAGKVVTTNVNITASSVTNAGGAVYLAAAPASLTMTGGTISGNNAPNGGAIFSQGGSVSLTNMTLANNAGSVGGALYTLGAASISGTSFTGNIGTNNGGAIAGAAAVTVSGGSFTANSSAQGGAIYNNTGSITVTSGSITGNTGASGSAIFNQAGTTSLTNTAVNGNGTNATTLAGGIYLATGSLTMNGGSLSSNTAQNAGALFNAGTATLDGTTVNTNHANGGTSSNGGNGGAIYNAASLIVKNAGFSGNRVTLNTNATPGITGYGGAIASFNLAANAPTVSLTNTTIAGGAVASNANVGGAISAYQSTLGGTTSSITATGLTLSSNSAAAAGGIFAAGNVTLNDSTLTGNKATHASAGNGGALYLLNALGGQTVLLDGTDVVASTAAASGGGVFNAGAALEIRNGSAVDDNVSPLGAGLYNGGPLTIKDSQVSGNDSANSGAGIYTLANTTLAGVDVTDNTAAFLGGGIVHGGGALTVTGGQVSDNSAFGAGGLILGAGLPATFDGTDFKDNTSTGANFGGGAVLSAGQLSIKNATITGNKADGASGTGGAIFSGTDDPNVATSLKIDASLLADNEAFAASAVYARSTGSGSTNKTAITNATITGNDSTGTIGALQLFQASSITGSTITDNTAVGAGNVGGLVAFANTVALSGSILSGNSGTQCFQAVADGGYNLVTPGNTACGLSAVRNDVFAAPQLGALAANGGPTQTLLPSPASPALDRIPANTATGVTDAVTGSSITLCAAGAVDQRGTARPQGARCDIGAVEKEQTAPSVSGPASATYSVGVAGAPLTYVSTGSPQATLSASGLPAGVVLTDNGDGTATIAGTPGAGTGGVHNVVVTATNEAGSGSAALTLTVNQAPALSGPSAATYLVGTPGGPSTFTSTGHPTSILSSLGLLPGGVAFTDNGDGTGAYAGTPAIGSGGLYNLTVKAANGTAPDATAPFALTVNEAAGINGPASATFEVGTPGDSAAFTASGFPVPTFSATGLPGGLSVVGTGPGVAKISGNAVNGTGGIHPVTVTATNGIGTPADKAVTVTVNEAPEITGPSLARFVAGTANAIGFSSDGYPQASFTKTGALPLGLTFTDNGNGSATISGTASALLIGTYNITVRASNGVDPDATLAVQIQVVPQLAIATTSLPNAGYRTMYSAQLNATGGQPAYDWEIASGSLPAGLSLSSAGQITGATTANPGTYGFTVRVTDSAADPQVRTKALSITVVKGATTVQPEGTINLYPNGDVNVNVGLVEADLKGGFPQVPIAGATVTFKSGAATLCSGVTDVNGHAKCSPNVLVALLFPLNRVTASYAGSTVWAASTGSAGLIRQVP